MQGPPPGPKKTSPWVWVAIGVVGFFVLVGICISIAVHMFVKKVTDNPALTMAKLLTAANPDVEVVDSDSRKNTVTFRDKKTGETITLNFDDIKRGRLEFRGSKGQSATIQAQATGDGGTVEVKGPDGSMQFGSGVNARIPDWVPVYPGVTPKPNFTMQSAEGASGSYQFSTKDPASAVLRHYENALKTAGFKITSNIAGDIATVNAGMVSGEDEAGKHSVIVTVGRESGGSGETGANVIFATKR
jgi:hypothetical protein